MTIQNRIDPASSLPLEELLNTLPGGFNAIEDIKERRNVINSLIRMMTAELPPISKKNIKENTFCYDLMYSDNGTVFTEWANENGASEAIDGLGMFCDGFGKMGRRMR